MIHDARPQAARWAASMLSLAIIECYGVMLREADAGVTPA